MKQKCPVKRKRLALAFFAFCALACFAMPLGAQSSQTVLHYKDVVGTYKDESGSVFTIDRAAGGMLRVGFHGVYPYRTANGEMSANTGEAEGTTKLVGNAATFKPADTEQCRITLVFKAHKLIVTQEGTDAECGFGHNVNASGTYRLRSTRVQRFNKYGAPVKRKT